MEMDSDHSEAKTLASDHNIYHPGPRRRPRTKIISPNSGDVNPMGSPSCYGDSQKQRTEISPVFSQPCFRTHDILDSEQFELDLILKPPPSHSTSKEMDNSRGSVIDTSNHYRISRGSRPSASIMLRHIMVGMLLCWMATSAVVVGAVKDDAVPVDDPKSSSSLSPTASVPRITQQPVSQTLSTHAVTMVTCGVSPTTAQVRWLYNGLPLDHRRHPGLEVLDNGLRFLPILSGLSGEGEDLWERELDRAVEAAVSRSGRQADSGISGSGSAGNDGMLLSRRGNEGEYRCTATTAAGSVVSQPAILSIPVLEEFPSGEDLTLEVPEGGYVTLPCAGPYSLPEAELYVVGPMGTRLQDGTFRGANVQRLPSGAVVLSKLTPEATGTYRCMAVNQALGRNVTSPYVINVAVVKSHTGSSDSIHFLRGPRRTVRAVFGSSVTLECPTYGPDRTRSGRGSDTSGQSTGSGVVWARAGGTLPPGRFRIDHLGNLVLQSLDFLDRGTYICSESHASSLDLAAGTQSDSAHSASGKGEGQPSWVEKPEVQLEIISFPVARIVTPLEDAVEMGQAVKLSCFVGGYPAPDLAWYHNGRRLDGTSAKLVLPQVSSADAGLYQCMATNEVGSAQGVARLKVRETAAGRDKDDDGIFVKEEADVKPSSNNNNNNNNNGQPGTRGNRRRDRKKQGRRRDMKLKVRRKKKNQKVGYPEGREKPKYEPSIPTVDQLSDRSVKLSWTVQDKGNGQTIKFFKVQYKEMAPQKTEWKTCDPQLSFSTRDFEVTGLKSGASYKFRVLAVYEDDDNRNSANTDVFQLRVQSPPTARKPDTPPTIVEVQPVNFKGQHGLALKWQYKAESASPIEGFIIYYKPWKYKGPYESQTFPDAGIRNHVLQGLDPDTDYTICMKTFNSEGESEFSNKVNGKTKPHDTSVGPVLPPVFEPPVQPPPPTDSPETNRQERSSNSLGQPIILVIAIGILVGLLIPLVVLCLCKYWRQKRRGLDGNPQYKFQEQTQCFLAPGGDPSTMKQQHPQPHPQQQQQQQQINGGLYPSANSMGNMAAGSSTGQGHGRMNLGVNPLAEYDLQNSGGGPGAGHSKQYYPNGGSNGMGSRYTPGEHHQQHTCNNNLGQHPHMAALGDMAYMEQQQSMHPMQHRTLPTAPTPHSFYSEAGSLGRLPAHSTSTVNHDYSEPGEHEIILQQKSQRPGIPMSSSGLSHHPPPPQQPPQPPPPLLTHQPQQQQYPFYNQAGGMADMMGPNQGQPHHNHPHGSNATQNFGNSKPISSNANASGGNLRHYEPSWSVPYDQPRSDNAPNSSGTLGRNSNSKSNTNAIPHPHHHAHQDGLGPPLPPMGYNPTSSSSSSSSYSPTKQTDFSSNFGAGGAGGVGGNITSGVSNVHPQTMMSSGPPPHMHFVPPAHPHRRPGGGREGAEGPGGGKHQRRRKKRPQNRGQPAGLPGGHRETGMKDQATNTDLSSNEGGFEFTTFNPGSRGKTSSVGGSSQSGSEGEGHRAGSRSETEDLDQDTPAQELYHYCDSSFANHGSTESLEGLGGEDSNSGPSGSSDEEEGGHLNHPGFSDHNHPHHHHFSNHPHHLQHQHHHHHHHPSNNSNKYHHHQNQHQQQLYQSRQQQTSPTSPVSSTYQPIFPTSGTHVPVPL